jgi:hypothetical protein
MRGDLRVLKTQDTTIVELRMLTAHRADLATDPVQAISRLSCRLLLLGVFPALERQLDFTNKGPLILISMFQTPQSALEAGREGGRTAAARTTGSTGSSTCRHHRRGRPGAAHPVTR